MLNVTGNTKLKEIVEAYPNFIEVGAKTYPDLKKATGLAWFMVKNLTVNEAAPKIGMSTAEAISKVNEIISQC